MRARLRALDPTSILGRSDLAGVTVEAAANSAFFATGQRCTASSRLIVTEGIHDRFMAAMTEKLKGLTVDEKQLKTDTDYIEIGKYEGAKPAFGGELANC